VLKKGVDIEKVRAYNSQFVKATPVAPPDSGNTPAITTWGKLMEAIVVNKIDKTFVNSKCVELGVIDIADLQNNPGIIPQVAAAIGL
jgi:hypothetical protein